MIQTRFNQGSLTRKGSGLPFYPDQDFIPQRRSDMNRIYHYTWLCPHNMGIPFQFSVPAVGTVTATLSLQSATGGTSYIGAGWNALLSLQCFDDGTLITYNGGNFPATIVSGAYYFEIIVSAESGEVSAYSDDFFACTTVATNAHLLTWWAAREWLAGVYYNGGSAYKNKMWLRTDMARPKVEYTEEVVEDGYGRELPVYQRSEDIYNFDVLACDSQVGLLYRIAHHDSITLKSPLNATAYSIVNVRASDTGEKSEALAVVEVSFKVDYMESTTIDFEAAVLGAC